jgi:hypothetical protein
MGFADQGLLIDCVKIVGVPIEGNSHMPAFVDISIVTPVFIDDKTFLFLTIQGKGKLKRGKGEKFSGRDEK